MEQCKNCKNFLDLCYPWTWFWCSWSWFFFATNCGKSSCVGISGTLKRLAAMSSIQGPTNNQILKPVNFFSCWKDEVISVLSIFLSHEKTVQCWSTVKVCYEIAKAVPSASFHLFTSLSTSEIVTIRLSEDEKLTLKFSNLIYLKLKILYISCIYNHSPWTQCGLFHRPYENHKKGTLELEQWPSHCKLD